MIFQKELREDFALSKYFTGRIKHFTPVRRHVVHETASRTLGIGESLYSKSQKVFPNQPENWHITAEANRLKRPQDWSSGEVIKLPLLISEKRNFVEDEINAND